MKQFVLLPVVAFLTLLAFSSIASAEMVDVVHLKNGSIIQKSVQIIDTNIPDTSILISGVKYALYNCRLNLPEEYYYLWENNRIRFDHDFLRKKSKQKNMNLFN